MAYLDSVLEKQRMLQSDIDTLHRLRNQLQTVLLGNWKVGNPRFYYAGSYAKKTMLRESFDLDLVVYFPPTDQFTVKAFYEGVESRLMTNKYKTQRHNVAIRLLYEGGFHIDVVPGRAVDNSFMYANLYSPEKDSTKRTSIKLHIDAVRSGGNQDVIKLTKLWRLRHQVNLGSFAIELVVAKSLTGKRIEPLADRFWEVLGFLRDDIGSTRLVDPANSNNIVSDDISSSDKLAIASFARLSRLERSWEKVVW